MLLSMLKGDSLHGEKSARQCWCSCSTMVAGSSNVVSTLDICFVKGFGWNYTEKTIILYEALPDNMPLSSMYCSYDLL
jgi:hypothetical protein